LQTRLAPHIRTFIKDEIGEHDYVIIKKLHEKDMENMMLQYFGRCTVWIQCCI